MLFMLAVGKMQFLQPCLPSHELGRLLGGTGEGEAGTVMLYLGFTQHRVAQW